MGFQFVLYAYWIHKGIFTGSSPAMSAILMIELRLKQFICSSGLTGLREFLDPFGAVQSKILSLLLMSPPLGTLIFISPSDFNDFFRWQRVSRGAGMCSKTCSVFMKSKL